MLAYTAPIWVLAAVLTWVPIAGRPMVEWLPVACWWLWRTTGGRLLYRRRIIAPRPARRLSASRRATLAPATGAYRKTQGRGMHAVDPTPGRTPPWSARSPISTFVLLDPSEQV